MEGRTQPGLEGSCSDCLRAAPLLGCGGIVFWGGQGVRLEGEE